MKTILNFNNISKAACFVLFLSGTSAMAQNSLPDSGDVGIGTLTPTELFEIKQNNTSGAFRMSYGSTQPALATDFGYPAVGGFVMNAKANSTNARFHFRCDGVEKFQIHKEYLKTPVPFRGNLEVDQYNADGGLKLGWGSEYPTLYTEAGYPAAGGFVMNAKANGTWARFHFKCDDVEKFLIHKDYLNTTVPFRGDLEIDQNNAKGGLKLGWGPQYNSLYSEIGYPAAGGLVINAKANGSWARVHFKLDGTEKMQINKDYVSVNGLLIAEEIQVKNVGADYVFEEGYNLKSITEVEKFIKENKHLPDVAPACETEKGIKVGEFNELMLRKVEELTLYVIQLNKEVETLKAENAELKK